MGKHNSFGFYRMFLKPADKLDMDEISNDFENWPMLELRPIDCWKRLC